MTVKPGATGAEREVSHGPRRCRGRARDLGARARARKTALVRLDQFSAGAADAMKAALGEIKAAGADRIVLDLRGNPGGYVNEADAVASQFLKSGVVFIERAADGHETKHEVTAGGLATDLPLVVLVDGGTASSSEIVSGAIQDAGRAQIVGDQDVRDRDGPRRVPAVGRVGAARRDGRMADARGSPDLARGHHPGRRSSSARATSRRSTRPGRQDDAGPDRGAHRPAAGTSPDPGHRGHDDRRLIPTRSGYSAERPPAPGHLGDERLARQHDVGCVLTAFGGAVCGSTQIASSGAV